MRSSSYVVALMLAPALAAAHGFDKPGPPLADLLARAHETGKPLLLDFSTVW